MSLRVIWVYNIKRLPWQPVPPGLEKGLTAEKYCCSNTSKAKSSFGKEAGCPDREKIAETFRRSYPHLF